MVKKIGLVGDSIGHGYYDEENLGWFARLGQLILKKYRGVYVFNNMSQSGDNIADACSRAVFEVNSREFELILVNIGINDLRRRKNSGSQLDFSEGARTMYWNRLLDVLEKSGAKVVVLDLIPVVENKYTEDASLVRYNADVVRYNEIIKQICKERHIAFFERFDKWIKNDLNTLYKDATHPNTKGHQRFAEEVFAYLEAEKLL